MTGRFYGLGVGPGAPDLLTLRAVAVLKTVHAVCVPRSSADGDSIALRVAGPHIPPGAEIIEISTPMTRDRSVLEAEWRQGARTIAGHLAAGRDVAFITIGDAMLFSTYTYLLRHVRAVLPEVRVESVPGVTSFAAAAAHLNIALAEGTEKLAVVPAVDDPEALRPLLAGCESAVLMKVAGKYEEIVAVLDDMGLKDKAVFVSKLGYPEQSVTFDLDSLVGKKRDYLSLIIVKKGGL